MLAHTMARLCDAMKGNGDALKGIGDAQLGKEWICIGKAPFSIVLQWQRDVWSSKGTATQSTAVAKQGVEGHRKGVAFHCDATAKQRLEEQP